MNDTPRTDALERANYKKDVYSSFFQMRDLAWNLERELAAVTEQRDVASQCHKWCYEDRKRITEELNAVTEQRDRLAEAMWNMLNQEHGSAIKAGILLRSLNLQYLNPNAKVHTPLPASANSETGVKP